MTETNEGGVGILKTLEGVISERRRMDPRESYVAEMLRGSEIDLYRKVPEEATEVVLACTSGGNLAEEVADLWFHSLLVMAKHGVTVDEVSGILAERRAKKKG